MRPTTLLYRLRPLLFLLFCGPAPAAAQTPAPARPNIILFLVDDMGWEDSALPFWTDTVPANRIFRTPNMLRLAARGVQFTAAYANAVCTPSRVSLMTGMNEAHHRVTNWTLHRNGSTDAPDSLVEPPDWNVNGLSPRPGVPRAVYATTLPQLLQEAGYFTIHCGKAHFGAFGTPGEDPLRLGFMVNIGGSAAGHPASYLGEKDYGHVPGRQVLRAVPGLEAYWHTPTFLSEALTREAMKALDSARSSGKPFFLYMAHYAVHLPYQEDARYVEDYLRQGLRRPEAAYAALIEGMDKSLGDLLDYLDAHGLRDNTIVLFMSDNGGYSHAPRSGRDDTQNYPLRAGKASLYEGGIREPMLVCWPGVTAPGTRNDQYVTIQDFFPTLLEMAGIRHPHTVQQVDGRSFVRLLKDPAYADSSRVLVWHYPNKWQRADYPGTSWVSAIRQGDWKLIYFQRSGRTELYRLSTDIGEQHDLSRQYPAQRARLAALLTQRLKGWNAQMPRRRDNGRALPWPDGSPSTSNPQP